MKKVVVVLALLVLALAVGLGAAIFGGNGEVTISEQELDQMGLKHNSYVNPGHLISVAEARELIAVREEVVLIDIRRATDYALGHIPGAYNIFRSDYSAEKEAYPFGGMRATRDRMEELLGSLGVTYETMILAYDAKGDYDAARFWWQLDMNGFENIKLIDGGIVAWEAAGFELSMRGVDAPTPVEFRFVSPPNDTKIATLDDIRRAQSDPNVVVLDTRAITEFIGEDQKSGAFRKGRIPGSVWVEYKDCLCDQKMFLGVDELREMYASVGVTPDKEIIAYCQSGVRSAHTTFVLSELLGFPNVKNYDGSWIEWSYYEELPLETGTTQEVQSRIAGR